MNNDILSFGSKPTQQTAAPDNPVYGIWRCQVVATNDPAMRGRVRLNIPSLMSPNAPQTYWADVCYTPGIFDPPEVGDQGFVMFENGDVDMPVFLGRYWANGEAPFQYFYTGQQQNDEEASHTVWDDKTHLPFHDHTKNQWYTPFIRTWMTPTGHYISFDDFLDPNGNPTGRVDIYDRNGKHISLYENGFIDIWAGTGTWVRLDAAGTITINSAGAVNVNAASASVTTTGDVDLSVGGNIDAEITGDGNIYLGSKDDAQQLMTETDAAAIKGQIAALATHTHSGVTTGAGVSGPPVQALSYSPTLTDTTLAS